VEKVGTLFVEVNYC